MQEIIEQQRKFAESGRAKDITFRILQLRKLKKILKENESLIYQSIHEDLNKSAFETYATELALIYQELNDAISNVRKWSKPKRVQTGFVNFPGKSFILPQPYGTTLIISAWNYPYQLTFIPVIAAISAGNACIIKPSELSKQTSSLIAKIINDNFDHDYLCVVEGGPETTAQLLKHRFDKLFFTGSARVGKIVAKAAAEYLTPVTLELGGKNPCIVLEDANLNITAQRIIWGKFLNAGQTCLAPDYLLVARKIYHPLLHALKQQIIQIFGPNPLSSEAYGRIINTNHTKRLEHLIDYEKIYFGGEVDLCARYISPTIIKDVTFSDEIMKEEIFGPILPVIPFTNLEPILSEIKSKPSPLALYIFGKNKEIQTRIINEVSFGGGCINDVVMHVANPRLPFGGVNDSGMGSYHSEAGFRAFSHFKSILKKPFWFETPIKYAPYNKVKLKLIKMLLG